ncbi:MAG: hypothetical protein JRE81_16755 [Deltaproteobacteria bacterium]|nr:hypothetical protein [Deltaproteobacteria bacterium]
MKNATATPELDSRKESYSNMNDWLNVLVRKRIAKALADDESLSPEMAWVDEHHHEVYQKRFKPFVFVVLALCAFGIAQTEEPLALLATFVFFYFYIDFYSGVLHVVLDNPSFVKLPLIGVPCVEFQWHHTFPYDISTRRLLDVWGDLNVLLLVKSVFLFGVCGFTTTALMVAGVGYGFGYANQFSHRLTHSAPRSRPKIASLMQERRLLLPPRIHHIHHEDHTQAFPVLNGHSHGLIQAMLRVVPSGHAWMLLFAGLTALDLVAVVWLLERFWPA